MLKKVTQRQATSSGGSFAIVASRYNARYVDTMLRAARAELKRAGAAVRVIRVPGAYEVPVVAASLARSAERPDAIVCLGVILRGETVHAAHIGDAVSQALMDIQLAYGVPVIHEVLLLENRRQAEVRCCNPEHNRGLEAAQTALAMAAVMREVPFARG
jgi:6,7-dimethyl-8-ribityllumazine synthase